MQIRRVGWCGVALMLPVLAAASWPLKDYVWLRNFHVVEPGLVYRGGEQKPGPLRRLIEQNSIRTVLCLAGPGPGEEEVTESMGVRLLAIPLNDESAAVTFDTIEQAAGVLADPASRPVFFHCKRGVYRSNLVQAVYRMKHRGWNLEQTIDELRTMGFDPQASGGDHCCSELLERYWRERVKADEERH